MLNRPLVEEIMAAITTTPERHDQAAWGRIDSECGTAYCIAGWACVLTPGYKLMWDDEEAENHGEVLHVLTPEGDRREIPDVAAELIGLPRTRLISVSQDEIAHTCCEGEGEEEDCDCDAWVDYNRSYYRTEKGMKEDTGQGLFLDLGDTEHMVARLKNLLNNIA